MKLKTPKIIVLDDFFILVSNHLLAGLTLGHQIDTNDILVNLDQTTLTINYYL